MSTRAAGAEVTRERIVDAAYEAFVNHWYDDVTMRGIAAAAGVALQTVLNHFPTKDDLCAAANARLAQAIETARWSVEPGDITAAIKTLVDDYERTGDHSLRMLAVEERVPAVGEWIALGRTGHQGWCEQMFASALEGLRGRSRARRLAQLVVATDVYAWKLLRRDKGLSRTETVTAMRELVVALHDVPQEGRRK